MAEPDDIPQIKPDFQKVKETSQSVNPDSGTNIRQIKPQANKTPELKQSGMKPSVNNPLRRTSPSAGKVPSALKGNFWQRLWRLPSDPKQKAIKIALLGGAGLVFFFLLASILSFIIIYPKARKLIKSVGALQRAVLEEQDIGRVKAELGNTKEDLISFQKRYRFSLWLRAVPLLGAYQKDGSVAIKAGISSLEAAEIAVVTIEPYADIIGFTAESNGPTSGEETANDRIEFIVQTIEEITPKLDEIASKATLASEEINKINPKRYPVRFFGKEVRGKVEKAISLVDEGAEIISSSRPLLEQAPYFLGIDGSRTYLLLFQNDKELRPTGGFITAYSIAQVEKGKFEPVSSDDIYNLDNRYKPSVPAPEPIINYIKGPYTLNKNLRLRDMNFDSDFNQSMAVFSKEVKKAGIKGFDGIIAVDTQVVVNLLDVLGEIGVPGFGNFSTKIDERCNCPQVIYELESFADVEGPIVWDPLDPTRIIYAPANIDNRKKIVGPLMNSILSNALGQPKEKLPALFQAAWKSLAEKHVLFYMLDDQAQAASESFNIAGRVKEFQGDYLYINDANLGGRKSNLYVTQEVHQEIGVRSDGTVEKILTITYKNPQGYDGWLNSVLPNWTRIYVPEGSELISLDGFTDKGEVYTEYGKTVFSGGFELKPEGIVRIEAIYRLPFKVKKDYSLLVQKQPGTDAPLHSIELGKQTEELFLRTDKEFRFRL